MTSYDPPPPYDPPSAQRGTKQPRPAASITTLPLHLLHRIISLTLDPNATPSRFSGDFEEEKVRRMWALFLGLRGVDRRFFLVSTSILRTHYLPTYLTHLPRGTSTDPFPTSSQPYYSPSKARHSQNEAMPSSSRSTPPNSILARSRETAVFDRFIAIHLGHLLRLTESSLSEPSEALPDLFKRLQPAARIEDLLLTLPPRLIVLHGPPRRQIPLPQSHLSVTLSPGWVSLWLNSHDVGVPFIGKMGRDLVLEVRRQDSAEGNVRRVREGLEDMLSGVVRWGERVL